MNEKEFEALRKQFDDLSSQFEELEVLVEKIEHAVIDVQGLQETDVKRDEQLVVLIAALAERDARQSALLELMHQKQEMADQQSADMITVLTAQVPAAVAQYAGGIEERVIKDYEWTKNELRRPLPQTRVQEDPLEDVALAARARQDQARGRP